MAIKIKTSVNVSCDLCGCVLAMGEDVTTMTAALAAVKSAGWSSNPATAASRCGSCKGKGRGRQYADPLDAIYASEERELAKRGESF